LNNNIFLLNFAIKLLQNGFVTRNDLMVRLSFSSTPVNGGICTIF